MGDITKKEIPHRGNVRDRLDLQFQDTYYRIVLQAHNELGFSTESSIIIKTKKGNFDFSKINVNTKKFVIFLDRVRGGTVIAPPIIDNTSSVTKLCTNLELFLLVAISIFSTSNFRFSM